MPKPMPINEVEEKDNGWYFPALGIHVAKTVKTIKKTRGKPFTKDGVRKVRVTEREVKVQVCKTAEAAKEHVRKHYGVDVDEAEAARRDKKKG